jgi:gluconokinase
MRELKLPRDLGELEAELGSRRSPDHGLTVLPFWTAERAPRWNEDDTGSIFGLRQSTTAADILQAIVESFHYRLAAIADEISRDGAPKWIVSGGGMKSRAALKRLANILGQPVYANPEPEASLRGAAVLAIERLGGRPAALKLGQPALPDREIHERYLAARAEQARLERMMGVEALKR